MAAGATGVPLPRWQAGSVTGGPGESVSGQGRAPPPPPSPPPAATTYKDAAKGGSVAGWPGESVSGQDRAPQPPAGRAPAAATYKHAVKVSQQPLAPLPPLVLGNSAISHDGGTQNYDDDQEAVDEQEALDLEIKKGGNKKATDLWHSVKKPGS